MFFKEFINMKEEKTKRKIDNNPCSKKKWKMLKIERLKFSKFRGFLIVFKWLDIKIYRKNLQILIKIYIAQSLRRCVSSSNSNYLKILLSILIFDIFRFFQIFQQQLQRGLILNDLGQDCGENLGDFLKVKILRVIWSFICAIGLGCWSG